MQGPQLVLRQVPVDLLKHQQPLAIVVDLRHAGRPVVRRDVGTAGAHGEFQILGRMVLAPDHHHLFPATGDVKAAVADVAQVARRHAHAAAVLPFRRSSPG